MTPSDHREPVPTLLRVIERARRGDAEAVNALCRHFEPRLAAHVARRMGAGVRRWIEPVDVVQAVLFEVLRSLPQLPVDVGEAELWRRLYRTANTRILDAVRNHGRQAGESVLPPAEAPAPASTDGSVTREDERRHLRGVIARLREPYASVLTRCVLEERTVAETARLLGLSEQAVTKRLSRARRQLAELLRPAGEGRRGPVEPSTRDVLEGNPEEDP